MASCGRRHALGVDLLFLPLPVLVFLSFFELDSSSGGSSRRALLPDGVDPSGGPPSESSQSSSLGGMSCDGRDDASIREGACEMDFGWWVVGLPGDGCGYVVPGWGVHVMACDGMLVCGLQCIACGALRDGMQLWKGEPAAMSSSSACTTPAP